MKRETTPAGRRTISRREEAAVRYAIAYGITSKPEIYRIAYDGKEAEADGLASLASVASRWWASRKIQEFYQDEKVLWEARMKSVAKKAVSDLKGREGTGKASAGKDDGLVDYSIPANQLRELNRIINDASLDEKTKIDALKTLIATQKGKGDKDGDIQRFYVPIKCHMCAVYEFVRLCNRAGAINRIPELKELNEKAKEFAKKIEEAP